MGLIYHITSKTHWQSAQKKSFYDFDALDTEGFIHCSKREQFLPVANRIFRNQTDLLLLVLDEEKIKSKVIYENLEGGSDMFPHIYGILNLDAVIKVHALEPTENGSFKSPLD